MQTMHEIAATMVRQFRQVANQIGLIDVAHGGGFAVSHIPLPIETTVIMASIIEKENALAEERPLVASVSYNRLAKKIALDADPSIFMPSSWREPTQERCITRHALQLALQHLHAHRSSSWSYR